jgi:uncharacterized protein with HEPN domain
MSDRKKREIVWQTIQEDLPFYEKAISKIEKDLF